MVTLFFAAKLIELRVKTETILNFFEVKAAICTPYYKQKQPWYFL